MRTLLTLAVAAATAFAAPARADTHYTDVGEWGIWSDNEGCYMTASYNGGTTVTVYSEDTRKVLFWVQNRKWTSLKEGASYKLDIEFDNLGEWPQTVVGDEGDVDGSGFIFVRSVEPTSEGDSFLGEFMISNTMSFRRDGVQLVGLRLPDTRRALVRVMDCVRARILQGDPFKVVEPEARAADADT